LVVHKPDREDPAYPLRQWDILTKIGDSSIDDEGMVKIEPDLRVRFDYLVQKIAAEGKVPLTVWRDGNKISVQLPVSPRHPMVLPSLQGAYPSYFIYGPLVFSDATAEFVAGLRHAAGGRNLAAALALTGSPLTSRMLDKPAFENESLVIISSPLFPHKLSSGYNNPAGHVIKSVNGVLVKNLAHLVALLRDCHDQFIVLESENRHCETLVFPRSEMVDATDGILTDNGIRGQGSPDMLAVWQAKQAGGFK
jgi:hypothetical protein